MGPRGKRVAGAVVFFVIALLLLTGLGLLLSGRQVENWVLVVKAEGGPAGRAGGYRKLYFGILGEWAVADSRDKPPAAVAELDGTAVEIYGLAREVKGANGFWLVTDPLALNEHWKPIIEKSVWIEMPPGTAPDRPIERGAFVRARGVLRVGLAEVAGAGTVAYRLEPGEIWIRESAGHTNAGATGDGTTDTHR